MPLLRAVAFYVDPIADHLYDGTIKDKAITAKRCTTLVTATFAVFGRPWRLCILIASVDLRVIDLDSVNKTLY